MAAWAPKLIASPYCFLTFVDCSVADRYYSLRVLPEPEATIRVLLDFRPLRAPSNVRPLELGPPPERRGFTAVNSLGPTHSSATRRNPAQNVAATGSRRWCDRG